MKGLGTIGVRHGRYHAVHKVLLRRVVGHSKPAPVPLTFVFFLCIVIVLYQETL